MRESRFLHLQDAFHNIKLSLLSLSMSFFRIPIRTYLSYEVSLIYVLSCVYFSFQLPICLMIHFYLHSNAQNYKQKNLYVLKFDCRVNN